ncbi:MAG: iron-sulfur cluster loop [Desulfurococcaceae archaeon]
MDIIGVDFAAVNRVSRALKNKSSALPRLNLYDERYYPPRDADAERVIGYFIATVALDHRFSRPGKPYYACLEDGCYNGSYLLYRLAMKKFSEDPEFFTPQRLSRVSMDEVRLMLSSETAQPPDMEVRAMLLRDLGLKLVRLYNSSALKLIESSNNKVRGTLSEPGLVDNLRIFRAYEDPVEKKPMLLIKFLTERGLFNPTDDIDVAVDNHLSRIALRVGLVMVSGFLWDKIKRGEEVTYEEDLLLRMFTKRAYRYVAVKSGISATTIDDFFWITARETCSRDIQPLCDKCLFKGFCRARRNATFMVSEHFYYNTWYY